VPICRSRIGAGRNVIFSSFDVPVGSWVRLTSRTRFLYRFSEESPAAPLVRVVLLTQLV
jgi:hypothetical protein